MNFISYLKNIFTTETFSMFFTQAEYFAKNLSCPVNSDILRLESKRDVDW